MPRSALVSLVVASAAVHAHADWTWALAQPGVSCTAHCNMNNQACIPGDWPTDAFKILKIAVAVGQTTCTNVKQEFLEYAPAFHPGTDTNCTYNPGVGAQASSCGASYPGVQRFCPCSALGVRWFLANIGQSCRDYCRTRGGVCGDETTVWPMSSGALNNVAANVEHKCTSTEAGTTGVDPSIGSDGVCHVGSLQSPPFCDAADWKNSNKQRLCPCWDVRR